MRIYTYFRFDSFVGECSSYNQFISMVGYKIPKNRMVVEEVMSNISLSYRQKLLDLINLTMESGDMLFIKGMDSLGSNFGEIFSIVKLVLNKKIRLICLEFSRNEICGDIEKLFFHFLKLASDLERKVNFSKKMGLNKHTKKAGRPEILNENQKNEVISMYKKGQSIYSIAKHFSVTRTVIQRLIRKSSIVITNKSD